MTGVFIPICAVSGFVAGGISGHLHSMGAHSLGCSIIGAIVGVPIGVATYWVIMFPFVLVMAGCEKSKKPASLEPPKWWTLVCTPLLCSTVVASFLAAWLAADWVAIALVRQY
jgi:ABC-type lipoprotein release transport system permease subunit